MSETQPPPPPPDIRLSPSMPRPDASPGPSGFAITALILGIVSLVIWPLGLIAAPICFIAIFMTADRGRGLAVGGLIASLLGSVACIAMGIMIYAAAQGIGDFAGSINEILEREKRYTQIGYERLGDEIGDRYDGKTLVILYQDYDLGLGIAAGETQSDIIIAAIKSGVDGRLDIKTVNIANNADLQSDDFDMMEGMLSAADFEKHLHQHVPGYTLTNGEETIPATTPGDPSDTVVLSLAGLPYDGKPIPFMTKAPADRPELALSNATLNGQHPHMKSGAIDIALSYSPDATFDPDAAIPEDPTAAFDSRWLLITPDTLDTTATNYPELFGL